MRATVLRPWPLTVIYTYLWTLKDLRPTNQPGQFEPEYVIDLQDKEPVTWYCCYVYYMSLSSKRGNTHVFPMTFFFLLLFFFFFLGGGGGGVDCNNSGYQKYHWYIMLIDLNLTVLPWIIDYCWCWTYTHAPVLVCMLLFCAHPCKSRCVQGARWSLLSKCII